MTDTLLIGSLIAIGSGIVVLIGLMALTMQRVQSVRRAEHLRLQRTLRELETSVRDARDEAAANARALRDEITVGLKIAGDALARGLAQVAERQERHIDLLVTRLSALTPDNLDQLREEALGHAKDLRHDTLEYLQVHAEHVRTGVVPSPAVEALPGGRPRARRSVADPGPAETPEASTR
jgi:hypothetical protein